MATPPTFPLEDQTDEDFFDKLVDDDYGTAGTHPEAADIVRAFSNISIGDMGSFPLDSGDGGFALEEEDQQQNKSMPSLEASKKDTFSEGIDPIGLKESTTELGFDDDDDKGVTSRGSVEITAEVSLSNSSVGGIGGSKGTSVKEVQWSAFSVDSQQFDSDLFGSNSDSQTENLDVSANDLKVVDEIDHNSIFAENPGADLNSNVNPVTVVGSYTGSFDQQDAQFYGSTDGHVVAGNDSEYWENLYPGWKFDSSTGQWYQVDGFESFDAGYDTSTNSQWDGYTVASGTVQEKYRENVQEARNEFISDHKKEISYLQQTAKAVVGVAEDCVTSNISSCYDVSQGIAEYPPNMVFDPQYPGWYYDTNTQQWHTLDSYSQTIPTTSDTIQEQLSQDVNASDTSIAKENTILYKEDAQLKQNTIQNQVKGQDWSTNKYANQSMWQPATVNTSNVGFYGNQQMTGSHVYQQKGSNTLEPSTNQVYNNGQIVSGFQSPVPGFESPVPAESMYGYNQPKSDQNHQGHLSHSNYGDQNSTNYSPEKFQSTTTSYSPLSYAHSEGRSSAGRPPHTLISFGFGGKLIVMKDATTRMDYGSQDNVGGSISILSLMEVMKDQTDNMGITTGGHDYFHALCQQSFPGPLVGGNATSKDVNKWIDERIAHYEPTIMDFRKGELLRLLLSLLKISCQHYGKLRSPYGSDSMHEETDSPESAVTKLFASARKNGAQKEYGSFTQCMLNPPSEGQVRTTAAEVQNLLVSGRRKEALECAQAGQLWGPALVLAAKLGEKFYIDTVKQMAHCQFISGSPLRTLCLLIAGQPADVFSSDNSNNSLYGSANISQQPAKTPANGILDDWEENLAIITGNRTKDDELVIVHLGDCLWKEKGEITAAHTCYLVAEANFESYSDSARLCLIGADHWRCPRTYASPEAIQRTELFEYSKVLGNSQFILLPFQPYKLIYAYMLAEVGRVSDSLRYCQASLKLLKNSGRVPEVEMWKSMLSSLEERLRTHQQGGYSTSLAPAKLVGKLFTSIDSTIHRMMGTPPLPPMPHSNVSGKENHTFAPKVSNSQSTNVISSLIPSPSTEAISDWPGDRKSIHSRSISEPDFGRSTKQDPKGAGSPDSHGKASAAGGPSRFGRIGSQLLQKTVGWVSKSRQAKLGETNKFYFNEKLKRWVEEGVEPPAEEPALPPPPTMPSFQNGTQDYNISSAFKSNGEHETKSHISSGHGSGIPPISPNPNQFSARGRMGVRSRYVDTFNKSGGMPPSSFQSPSVPSVKPPVSAKFFVPTTTTAPEQPVADSVSENNIYQGFSNGETSTSIEKIPESSFDSPSPPPPPTIQRFPSMGNIPHSSSNGNGSLSSRSRAASWSGSYDGMFNTNGTEVKSFMPANPSSLNPGASMVQLNGGGLGDDLHEVEL